jgi:hypothetical protein
MVWRNDPHSFQPRIVLTPLPLANALLVFASTLFAMSLAAGVPLFVVHSTLAVFLAGQLVGAATKARR